MERYHKSPACSFPPDTPAVSAGFHFSPEHPRVEFRISWLKIDFFRIGENRPTNQLFIHLDVDCYGHWLYTLTSYGQSYDKVMAISYGTVGSLYKGLDMMISYCTIKGTL